jgi:hypothetical protein
MSCLRVFLVIGIIGALACSCGGPEDKDGKSLKVGEQYLMTRNGLEPVPFARDRFGNRLEAGREYMMTGAGLEPVPHLRDAAGKPVEIGSDYFMTEGGLKLVQGRHIDGVIVDAAGRPLRNLTIGVSGTDFKATSQGDGAFNFPFLEGNVKLELESSGLPGWCRVERIAEGYLSRDDFSKGWNVGQVPVPCLLADTGGERMIWATPDGKFLDGGDGTISDPGDRLMWESTIHDAESWAGARGYAENLELADHTDWRLPTLEEVKNLAASGIACPWHGPAMIQGGLTVWAADSAAETRAAVVNLCSGKVRKATMTESAPGPGALAVRDLNP